MLAAARWINAPTYSDLRAAPYQADASMFDAIHQFMHRYWADALDASIWQLDDLACAVDDALALVEAIAERLRHEPSQPPSWVIGVLGDHLAPPPPSVWPESDGEGASVRH